MVGRRSWSCSPATVRSLAWCWSGRPPPSARRSSTSAPTWLPLNRATLQRSDREVARARERARSLRTSGTAGAVVRRAPRPGPSGPNGRWSTRRSAQREAEDRVAALQERLAEAEVEQERAVDRERRRRDGEVARLTAEVAALRRAEESRRADTRLPKGIAPGTTEAARAAARTGAAGADRRLQRHPAHRDDLDLEGQRTWLLQRAPTPSRRCGCARSSSSTASRRRGPATRTGRQQVEVRFTPAGITADDELVLAVEATDEPVVVVTDDRELPPGRSQRRRRGRHLAFLGVVGR
jgi:hypothetical protein